VLLKIMEVQLSIMCRSHSTKKCIRRKFVHRPRPCGNDIFNNNGGSTIFSGCRPVPMTDCCTLAVLPITCFQCFGASASQSLPAFLSRSALAFTLPVHWWETYNLEYGFTTGHVPGHLQLATSGCREDEPHDL
jgi:hypothetical protein